MNEVYLDNFSKLVDEFTSTKFLLIESKLSKFLSSIAKNKLMYALIEECLKGFDFENEFKKATESGELRLPTKAEKLVAFVFCVLIEADNKKLDFYKFLKAYFKSNTIDESLKLFYQNVIIQFKNVVLILCSDDNAAEKASEPETINTSPTFAQVFETVVIELIPETYNKRGCKHVETLLRAMLEVAKNENYSLFENLKKCLFETTKNRKFLKFANDKFLVLE